MRYAVISDIHANATALQAVLGDALAQGTRRVICLGDVVGYGPQPQETLDLIRRTAAVTLAGNHDDAVSGRQDAEDFTDLAADAVKRHRKALSAADLAWLRNLPYECEFDVAVAAHGDFTDSPRFNYVESEADAAANFQATDAQLLFVGHTHVPAVFLTGHSGRTYRIDAQDFCLEDGKRYLVNPGSVGYPREVDGTCQSSYAIYDSEARTVCFRHLPFAVSSVMQRDTPRRRRRLRALALPLAAVLAAGLICAYLFRPGNDPQADGPIAFAATDADPALLLDTKTLTLSPTQRIVRANLKVDKSCTPATLTIDFHDASGNHIDRTTLPPVKGQSTRAVRIPRNAATARFTATKPTAGANTRIVSFAPAAGVK